MASQKNYDVAPPRYEPPQACYPPNPGQPGGYQAHQPGHPPQQARYLPSGVQSFNPNQAVVIQPGTTVVSGGSYRHLQYPGRIICQHCQATVTTALEYETGLLTWIIAAIICLFGCWLGCCLIPFCLDSTKDVVHRCPNCQMIVGKYSHLH